MENKSASKADETLESYNPQFVMAEYNALREQILKCKDNQHQILTFSIIVLGTIMTIGYNAANSVIILLYPIVALFLAAIWLENSLEGEITASYIQRFIESKVGEKNIWWEHHTTKKIHYHRVIGFFGFRIMFVATELLTITVGFSIGKVDPLKVVLLIVDIICCLLTIAMLTILDWRRFKNKTLQYEAADES